MEERPSVMSQFKQQLSNSQAAGFAKHVAFAVGSELAALAAIKA